MTSRKTIDKRLTSEGVNSSVLTNDPIADAVPAMICIYNIKTGNYIYANSGVKKILGYSPEDFIKKGLPFVASLVHPDDTPVIMEKNSEALSKANQVKNKKNTDESIVNFVYRMKHKDGSFRWLHTDGSVFSRDKNGKVECVLNVSLDITESKKWEEDSKRFIEQSENRYKTFVSQSSEGIWRFELEKPIPIRSSIKNQLDHFYKYAYLAECNDATAKMYGFDKAEEITGLRLSQFLVREDPANIEYLTAFIKSGYRLTKAESHEKDKDGNDKYFENNLVGVVENGLLVRAWGTQSDVTEKKIAEESVRQSEERLRLATNAGKIGIWDWDIANNNIKWSDMVHEIHGIPKNKFDGTFAQFKKVIHPEDLKLVENAVQNALVNKQPYNIEFRAYGPRKRQIWLFTSAEVIFDAKGKPLRMLGAVMDVTNRKLIEQRKDDFIALASHELKTPVTSLKMYAYVLKNMAEAKNNPKLQQHIAKVDEQLDRLTSLIQDLLDVSRIQKGKISYSKEKFYLDQLLESTILDMRTMAVDFKITKSKFVPVMINGDKNRILQVIINLINNAIKYSNGSKKIALSMQKKKAFVVISVRDFGIGIPQDQLVNIFERFYQVEGGGTHTYPGLGLGLYISKEIIDRHEGKIWVESQLGKGSTFYFMLPISKA